MSVARRDAARESIAIVGMSCLFPQAPDVGAYWRNICAKVDAVGDPPESRDMAPYLERGGDTGLYCVRGGYIGDLARFHPAEFGVMPSAVDGAEPEQFVALELAGRALSDAGVPDLPFNRERTQVILGRGTFVNRGTLTQFQHGIALDQFIGLLRELHPEHSEEELREIRERLRAGLPPSTPEVAGGNASSLVSGRVANRFDLMGANYTIDAACASSLIAVEHAIQALRAGRCDAVLAGGVQVSTTVPIHRVFCHLGALSRKKQIRPFDQDADGTMLGEGAGMVVLKRLSDAERDGNRIYAVIRAVGCSSDGRAKAVLAPRVEGEALSLRRAYEEAGISPATVGLIEAHGTGMPVGDETEIRALRQVFGDAPGSSRCALGSVKSMISHLLPASGIAGLIKAALAVYHKVLPPTIGCEQPNPKLEIDKTHFYFNTETRPWIHGADAPRRAGVNAFGFGGINAHAIVEEYRPADENCQASFQTEWDSELVVIAGENRGAMLARGLALRAYLDRAPATPLRDVAHTLNTAMREAPVRLAIVAAGIEDLARKLDHALARLSDPRCRRLKDRSGIYFFEEPLAREGKMAFLFPGEGSQYPNMLADLCRHFPVVRGCFDRMDRAFLDHPRGYRPSEFIFPPPAAGRATDPEEQERRLWRMDGAVESVFVTSHALYKLLASLGLRPQVVAGHSGGEFSALLAAGAIRVRDDEDFVRIIRRVNGVYERLAETPGLPAVSLVAVGGADPALVNDLVEGSGGRLHLAIDNCRSQVVLAGEPEVMSEAVGRLRAAGALCNTLPFDRPYHTPIFEPVYALLQKLFPPIDSPDPDVALWSCATAAPYPAEPEEARHVSLAQWIRRVRFRETVEAMYADGVRIFVEVGPRGNLTSFANDVLGKRPALAVASNVASRSGITQLHHLLGLLAAQGVPMKLDPLYQRREPRRIDLSAPASPEPRDNTIPISLALPRLRLSEGPGSRREEARSQAPAAEPSQAIVTLAPPASAALEMATAPAMEPEVRSYFATMEQFLSVQAEVMQTFLADSPLLPAPAIDAGAPLPAQREAARPGTASSGWPELLPSEDRPLIGEIVALEPGQSVVARRRLRVSEDLFLSHHALGGVVSTTDPSLRALPVMPLAMTMEMALEGAALLAPGERVVGLAGVRAQRWVSFEEGEATIEVRAWRESADRVRVEVREAAPGEESPPILEATALFARDYPEPTPAVAWSPRNARASRWTPERVYRDASLHGPAFQGVERVESWGEDGLVARLHTLPVEGLFLNNATPRFQLDPQLLDAALQLVSFWHGEQDILGFNTLPFGVDSLTLYGPSPAPGAPIRCEGRITRAGDRILRSSFDLLESGGRTLLRLSGCESYAFDLPEAICRITARSRSAVLSRPWSAPCTLLAPATAFRCRILEATAGSMWEGHGNIFEKGFAHLVLGRREREAWRSLHRTARGRTEWLIGRAAAKDAVCDLLHRRHGLDLLPADVEIAQDERGRPLVRGAWTADVVRPPDISIAHSRGVAVALAVDGELGIDVGIDVERVRNLKEGFDGAAFSREEAGLLAAFPEAVRAEWRLRAWCAKEAVAKALGTGLGYKPRDLIIRKMDEHTGTIAVEVGGEIARLRPDHAGQAPEVHTLREEDLVVAICTCTGRDT